MKKTPYNQRASSALTGFANTYTSLERIISNDNGKLGCVILCSISFNQMFHCCSNHVLRAEALFVDL